MSFPPRFLDELRTRLSLAEIVERRVKLTRRGREFVGLCPFHNEKTPSFAVVEDKGFYHCFGCGAHGDVIGFTMRTDNLGFREAVEALARQAGLDVPEESPRERERAAHAATLHDACEAACAFFEHQLRLPAGARGMAYLRARGLTPEMMARFRLGYAPAGGTALADEQRSRWYDFFRDRVMFPIADRQGRIIAFGGRIIGDGQPKYVNSPDTPIFQKGHTLYALNIARTAARDAPVIVAEGYMDVIALHAAGFAGAVAPLGTALTEEQLLEVWKLAPDPVLCFDGDAAGRRAADRAVERALPMIQAERGLRFVALPRGEDPDSLIRSAGPDAFSRLLAEALPLSRFLWGVATEGRDFTTPEKINALQSALKKRVLRIEDRETQRYYWRFISDMLWDLEHKNRRKFTAKAKDSVSPQVKAFAASSESADREKLRSLLVAIVLNHPEIVHVDIDQFASIAPRQRSLSALQQKLIDLIAEGSGADSSALEERLTDAGFGEPLRRLRSSECYRSHGFAHPDAPLDRVALGWRATFSRLNLPETKRQLDEALARCSAEPTDENWDSVLTFRRLYEAQHMEAEFMSETDESVERTRWRPRARSAAPESDAPAPGDTP